MAISKQLLSNNSINTINTPTFESLDLSPPLDFIQLAGLKTSENNVAAMDSSNLQMKPNTEIITAKTSSRSTLILKLHLPSQSEKSDPI